MSRDGEHCDARPTVKLGFLGVGWIGRHRMQAMAEAGGVDVAAFAEPDTKAASAAADLHPAAKQVDGLDQLLDMNLDGVVIATPSALHAEQSIRVLKRGVAVFCQKPLGRTGSETEDVVRAAKAADRLLGVDLSYRFTQGAQMMRDFIRQGDLGEIFAADLVFHNAYGPDKPWFYDIAQSGGGCVIDLGVHLVDLALWLLDFPAVESVESDLFAKGRKISRLEREVEDYGVATLRLQTGAVVKLACSWNLHAGRDAVISTQVHGTTGGAEMRNVDGSFYDFITERREGASNRILAAPPEDWGGRAAVAWIRHLRLNNRYDPEAERLVIVSRVLDRIYGR